MIHPDEALKAVLEAARAPRLETVPLERALGRVLPIELRAQVDQPPFDKSAMDGFACRGPSPERGWLVRETIAAGSSSKRTLAEGECARIMTGAPLPSGADRVQRVEWSEQSAGRVKFTKPEPVDNIIRRGENLARGGLLLGPRRLAPQDLGLLAADGRAGLELAVPPTVGVLSTGSELVEPGLPLGGADIYDSNRRQALAQAEAAGCPTRDFGRVADDPAATLAAVSAALEGCDILVVSGGVSAGDFDFVPAALARAGVETVFHGVAMKPGRPTYFGRRGPSSVFGLPGNPVSVFVNFEVFVKPLIYALMGLDWRPPTVPAPAARQIGRGSAERVEWLPVAFGPDGFEPVEYRGSSMLNVFTRAEGLLRLEVGQRVVPKGALASVRLLS